MENFYEFLIDHGAMRERDYKYAGRELKECRHDFGNTVGKVKEYYTLPKGSVEQMKQIVAKQPMDVALCATNFNNIGSGIMKTSDKCCKDLNHAVTIVGYHLCPEDQNDNDNDNNDGDNNDGDNKPEPFQCIVDKWWYSCKKDESKKRRLQNNACIPYWIVQNSWSARWGDKGFIKIEMTNDDFGVCGINAWAEFADWTDDMY